MYTENMYYKNNIGAIAPTNLYYLFSYSLASGKHSLLSQG